MLLGTYKLISSPLTQHLTETFIKCISLGLFVNTKHRRIGRSKKKYIRIGVLVTSRGIMGRDLISFFVYVGFA
jgi:hypothetical protein